MIDKQQKLENPDRVAELNPAETLLKIGVKNHHALCDIGAGSGIFTIAAAKMTKNKVFALELNDELLSVISEKAMSEGLNNIEPIKVDRSGFNVKSHSVDVILLVTVLHEIPNRNTFLKEAKRILTGDGIIAVIEFFKQKTPMGPPTDHRIAKEDIVSCLKEIGFTKNNEFILGENFYCMVFTAKVV